MSNPFEAPSSFGSGPPPANATGTFDVAQAFRDGLDATSRNWLPWLGVVFVGGFASGLSFLACFVPALVVVPALTYGQWKFSLDALDGDAEFATLFEGFNKLGEILGPMLGVLLLMLLVSLPGIAISQGISLVVGETTTDQAVIALASLLGMGIQSVWTIVFVSRFWPAGLLVVDRGMGPVDAMTESWNMTANCWPQAMMLAVGASLASVVGIILCCVGLLPASMIVAGAQASMYRQLMGQR